VNNWFTGLKVIQDSFSTIDQRFTKVPFFAPDDANALSTENLDVSQIIDLNGKGPVEALALVEGALHSKREDEEVRLWFKFDPPTPGGGETLFQPVGRRLRDAVKHRQAVRAMPAQGGGWIVRLAAKPQD
jgi:hypothetical protein